MASNTEDAKDTTEKRKVRYKYCVVPGCRSSTVSTPRKLFFSMPNNELRQRWCALMGRRPPLYQPLSAKCNRFCCEDHFDLENDMENYIRWKLMGKDTKKLFLKKGVVPHKFDCQRETTAKQAEEKSLDQFKAFIEKQKESKKSVGQRTKKERKTRVNTKMKKPTDEEQQQETREDQKKSEGEKISEQKKKIKNISRVRQAAEVSSQEREIETYAFEIKVEAEDYYELNDDDSILEEFISQDSQSTAPDNSHFLDVSVKVEELDEEFELEVVEEETRENMIEAEPDATVTTEAKPV